MTMTKADLVNQIYDTHNVPKTQACGVVESFLEITKSCLISGEDLLIAGFGKFHVKDKKARRGRNPQSGEVLMLDARRVFTFHPSGNFKDHVNK